MFRHSIKDASLYINIHNIFCNCKMWLTRTPYKLL